MKNKVNLLAVVWSMLLLVSCNTSYKGDIISLNGIWEIDETELFDSMPPTFKHTILVPSFIDMAEPSFAPLDFPNDTNRVFWYRKEFVCNHETADEVLLELRKVKYGASVIVNGKLVGHHNLAFSSVKMDIKPFLNQDQETNELVVRVGTRENFPDTLVCGADFEKSTFFPGIFDEVKLHLKKRPYIENAQIVPDLDNNKVKLYFNLKTNQKVLDVPMAYQLVEHISQKVVASGSQAVSIEESMNSLALDMPMSHYHLWTPENPFLYDLHLSTGNDSQTIRFGMRRFCIDQQTKRFELNGNPYFLLGTNVAFYRFAEDAQREGKAWDKAWVRKLFSKFKEMGWNSFRFHVGPAPDFWYDLADEMGFLIQDEYAIWYGKGGVFSFDPKVSVEQLALEYTNWMQDRWNHPSVVIWDAQNETVSRNTGPAIELVRDLDRSNRPWDNGYSKPARETDMIEAHPYLLYEFSQPEATVPEEGIMKHLFGVIKMPYNGPNEHDPDPVKGNYENAVVINEYGWLWLNRDGSPTALTDNVYELLFDNAQDSSARIETYARTLAAMTEYWRAHGKVAGIQYFAGLTYSRPSEPRGQTSDAFVDLDSLNFHAAFLKYVKPAFSKVALMTDVWEKVYDRGSYFQGSFFLINDSEQEWSGEVSVSICNDFGTLISIPFPMSVGKHSVQRQFFELQAPHSIGVYELQVGLTYNNERIVSRRILNVK